MFALSILDPGPKKRSGLDSPVTSFTTNVG
jgi:hypothetical protein